MKPQQLLLWLVVLLGSPLSAPAEDSPRADDGTKRPPDASALRPGAKVEGKLAAQAVRMFALETSAGDYVHGRLDGDRMRLTLLRGDAGRERVLVAKGGQRQEFMFVAGDQPPYSLEIHAESEGPYAITIDSIVPPSAQIKPAEVLESPRLRRLQQSLAAGGTTDEFWREARRGRGPLIERDGVQPPLADGTSLVTFLWRGAKTGVRLFGAPSNDHDDLKRLAASDVWYGSYRVPNAARIAYKLAPDVPELDASFMVRRRAILATAQRDPLNPHSVPARDLPDKYAGESLLELPEALPSRWLEHRPAVPAGTVERLRMRSPILDNTRDVFVYRPAGYRPGATGNALLFLFDGDRYVDDVGAPTILDNLITDGAIPPTAAVFIGNPGGESRSAELPPNPKFARFLAEELMPWARGRDVHAPAASTVVAGASYGGLAAAYAGWMHPDLFGNVLSQSGSFWWSPGASPGADAPEDEPEWLTRQIVDSSPRPVRFYLEAGRFEVGHRGSAGILETTRHLRDVLRAKGYVVHHSEPAGAHGFAYWHYTLPDGLIALLGKQASSVRDTKSP
jgi:enterochelin esterase family protein